MKVPELDIGNFSNRLCFACGPDNPIGLKLKPVYDGEKVRAEFTPGEFHQGWENVTHGGILYTLLDEVAAYAILCYGIDFGVTAKSEVRFKQIAPTNEPIQISAWVTKLTRRLVETEGVLTLKDNMVIAEGNSLFYVWRRSKKTVLWDMDGVIADSNSFHFAAWQETLAKRGVKFTKEDFTKLFGTRNDFIIRSILGEEATEQDIETIAQKKEAAFRSKARGNIKPFPGVTKLLDVIKKGNFKLGLVSSAPMENINMITGDLGIENHFNCTISGREVRESKPSPQIFFLAAEKLEAAPKDCVVIEDSPLGVKAAKAAGMKCLAVTNTHLRQELNEADKVVDSLEDIDLITLIQRV
jgi:haloacid dehalogenase superfamily, subfamily IA, variant 3 with third motif having DD or ED/haloacid dehalogenase superfamily, subfamily IA, variant 1 with third motif having Dx(3-4)D or Dx(3-4)E